MKRKIFLSTLISAALILGTLSPVASAVTGGGGSASTGMKSLEDLAYMYKAYWFMNACGDSWGNTINSDDAATNLKWFTRSNISNSGYLLSGNGTTDCNNGADWLKRSVSALGYSTNTGFLEAIGYTREADGGYKSTGQNKVKAAVTRDFEIYLGASVIDIGNRVELNYWINYRNFTGGCEAQKVGLKSSLTQDAWTGDNKYVIYGPDTADQYVYSGKGSNTRIPVGYNDASGPDGDHLSCRELADLLNSQSAIKAYRDYMDKYENGGIISTSNSTTPPGSATSATAATASTCAVNGIGWIVCPVMNFLGGLMDKMIAFLGDTFLKTDAKLVEATDSNGTYVAWKIFRNYANIAFIVAFLFIIYSQITGAGASNYGLKRMLPRLVTAALLVNLSFIICQIAVDISNTLGYGVTNLFNGILEQVGKSSNLNGTDSGTAWADALGGANGVLLTGIGVGLALALGILIPALLAVLMVVIILLARQAIIVLLVVASPLAFVAYLLPNTEQWFKKWYTMFIKLLVVFPIIAGVFGASKLAASIINNIGASQDDNGKTLQLMALGITAIPFFIVPGILKGAIAATGALGAKMQGWGDKATGRVAAKANGKAKERWGNSTLARYGKYREGEKSRKRSLIQAGVYEGKGGKANPLNWRSAANRRFNESSLSGKFGDRTAAAGSAAANKIAQDEIANNVQRLKTESVKQTNYGHPSGSAIAGYSSKSGGVGYLQSQLHEAVAKGDEVGAHSALQALKESGEGGVEAIQETLQHHASSGTFGGTTQNSLRSFINDSHSDLKGSDARITNWAGSGETTAISDSDLSGLTDEQIANQTNAALRSARTSGALDAGTRRRIGGAVRAGTIKTKQSKLPYFS